MRVDKGTDRERHHKSGHPIPLIRPIAEKEDNLLKSSSLCLFYREIGIMDDLEEMMR